MGLHVTGPRLVALLAIVLIVAAGLCIFDPPGDRSDAIDFCLLLFLPASAVILAVVLRPLERLVPANVPAYALTPRDPAAPPPRL